MSDSKLPTGSRAGRAGRAGHAILFVAPREKRLLHAIEKALVADLRTEALQGLATGSLPAQIPQVLLQGNIEAQGGLMKVGLYSTELEVGDIPGKIAELLETLESVPWLSDLYDFHPDVIEGLFSR